MLSSDPISAESSGTIIDLPPYDPSSIIVRFRPESELEALAEMPKAFKTLDRRFSLLPGLHEIRLPSGTSVVEAIQAYQSDNRVLYAEPNYTIQLTATPNDPKLDSLWALNNVGQTAGKIDADIDAVEAWDAHGASGNIVVAVIDTGVDYAHEDLASNMWINPGEIPYDGVDNDGNGYVDDVHGFDFSNNDSDPDDDHNHGSHAAGTIAAVGNNGIGVAGINWNAQIMALKFIDATGSGATAAAVEAISYAVDNGARISNNSWGYYGGRSQALDDAIRRARDAGHIFVAAAGNGDALGNGLDNDMKPFWPANHEYENVVAVAATDHNDQKAGFSNFGLTTVDLGAPGVGILSTTRENNYSIMSGTSMAAPHVTGALALLMDQNPSWSYQELVDRLLLSVEPVDALAGITVTGGRLNLAAALGTNNAPTMGNRTFAITTDVPAGTVVGSATASDPDGDPLTYSINAGNSGNTFAIDAGSGMITVADATALQAMDYGLTVKVSDGQLSDTATITVNVTSVSPQLIGVASANNIGEGGLRITAINIQSGVSYATTTELSGAYALPLATGTYTVTATRGSLGGPLVVTNVVIANQDVAVDFDTSVVITNREDIVGRMSADFWVGESNGTTLSTTHYGAWDNSTVYEHVAILDVNGDGLDDVVGRATSDGKWWVALSTGNSSFLIRSWGRWSDGTTWSSVNVGDFNGDGLDDIVGRAGDGTWWVAKSTGNSFVNEYWGSWVTFHTWSDVNAGDFNGDGKTDLVGRAQDGTWWVAKSLGVRFGNVYYGKWSPTAVWENVNVGDFNGDGMDDIAGRSASGQWWINRSSGSFFFVEYWGSFSNGTTWLDVLVLDADGDGRDDFVGRTASNGAWWLAHSTGTNFFNQFWGLWSGVSWNDVRAADFNGDGRDDIFGRTDNGQWWAALSNGSSINGVYLGSWSSSLRWNDVLVGNFV